MNLKNLLRMKKVKSIPFLFLLFSGFIVSGQSGTFNYFYRVYFRDKGDYNSAGFLPSDLLSERAILRREKEGIIVPDFRDLPVFNEYIDQVTSLGYNLHCTSKWMNTALFKTMQPIDPATLLQGLPFVTDVKTVKAPGEKSLLMNKLDYSTDQAGLAPFDRPVTMVNGRVLHNSAFDGKGILIAVLDGGFAFADIISSLNALHLRKGVIKTFDFVNNSGYVYDYHTHGTAVLSIIAGKIDGIIAGTAPGADFLLLRTEDTGSEFPVEEDFWVAAAEYADSAGADIISSSLGYFIFDDPGLNYKFTDLDGNSTFITRAADIAASKGILVFNSAGNERNKDWVRIVAPSDGDSVIAVGAVDGDGIISVFSSAGPSSDGRIKPDFSTMGVSVTIQTSAFAVTRSDGTSFSCPVLSGMTACLMQAVPDAANSRIIDALRSSSDRFNNPDSLYGYGIPDMALALTKLQDLYIHIPDNESVVSPNPTPGEIDVVFKEPPGQILVEIFSSSGVLIFRKDFTEYAGRRLRLSALSMAARGIYFMRLRTGTGIYLHKIIKLTR